MNDPAQPVLVAADVRKVYELDGAQVAAVDGVSFALPAGSFTAVLGPSGSGKSTLLHLLGALDTPTAGELYVDGEPLSGHSEAELTALRRQKVGFVFQQFHLIPNLSALENVMLPMDFAGRPKPLRRRRAAELLDRVGLSERVKHRPGRLSGGEQQRVAIARALANDPPIILADEPTGNLDRKTGEGIVALLGELTADDKTIVVVTHDEAIAESAQFVLRLEDGRLLNAPPDAFPGSGAAAPDRAAQSA